MTETWKLWKRNQTEQRKNGSDITIKTLGKHNRTGIISRGDTIHGKISTETFGTESSTEKIAKEKLTLDMGRKSAKRFRKNKKDVNQKTMSSTLSKKQREYSNNGR